MMEPYAGQHVGSIDKAPGVGEQSGSLATYTAGLGFALLLTGALFMVSQTNLVWPPGVPAGLAVLAIAQMAVHLVFFLHIGTGPDNNNNVLALAFGLLVVTLILQLRGCHQSPWESGRLPHSGQ
jgi:cytochrome o ubiquinol oxidase operon protein cyoD